MTQQNKKMQTFQNFLLPKIRFRKIDKFRKKDDIFEKFEIKITKIGER